MSSPTTAARRSRSGARRLDVPAAPRRARRVGLRLVLQRGREPDAVVPSASPLGARLRPYDRPRRAPRVARGLRRRSTERSPAPSSRSSTRDPNASVFFHDYHLYLAPRLVRDACARRAARPLRAHPVAGDRLLAVLPTEIRRAVHDGLLANDVVGFHTRSLASQLHARGEDIVGAVPDLATRTARYRRRRVAVTAPRSRSTPTSSTSSRNSPAVLAAERRARAQRPEKLILRVDRTDPSKNIVRGFRALRALPRRAPGDARACRDARAARPVAAGHSRVRRVRRCDPARGPPRQRSLPARRLDADRPPVRTTSRRRSPRTRSSTCCS